MLLDVIAAAMLAALLLVPIVNIAAAAIIGATLFGPMGAAGGVGVALSIIALEIWIADLFGWRDLSAPASEVCTGEAAMRDAAAEVAAAALGSSAAAAAFIDRVVTGPATQRRAQRHARDTTQTHARRAPAAPARRNGTR